MKYQHTAFSLTSRNLVNNGFNNSFQLTFPSTIADFTNCEIALKSLTLFNSVFNINAQLYQNNTFTLRIPTSGGYSDVSMNMPNGYYSIDDIDKFIRNRLIQVGAYLIVSGGQLWFPIRLSTNATLYAGQIDIAVSYNSVSGIPSGWSFPPSGSLWANQASLPSTSITAQLVVPERFGQLIGFTAGSYPSALNQTTAFSQTSNITPRIHPISTYQVMLNIINNPMSSNANLLTTFTTMGTQIGQVIDIKPAEFAWMTIPTQQVQMVELRILDQDFRQVQFQDPTFNIEFIVRKLVD